MEDAYFEYRKVTQIGFLILSVVQMYFKSLYKSLCNVKCQSFLLQVHV